jgi:hypothetical protein
LDDSRRITTGPLNPPRRGRPRKPQNGHTSGTEGPKLATGTGESSGRAACLTVAPVAPRLLDLHGAAAYLGVSEWTVRDLETGGYLRRVRLPLPNGGEVRKLLFALEDLDHLVNASKDTPYG